MMRAGSIKESQHDWQGWPHISEGGRMHIESCREVGPETACISLLMTSLVGFQQMELHVGKHSKEELFKEIIYKT